MLQRGIFKCNLMSVCHLCSYLEGNLLKNLKLILIFHYVVACEYRISSFLPKHCKSWQGNWFCGSNWQFTINQLQVLLKRPKNQTSNVAHKFAICCWQILETGKNRKIPVLASAFATNVTTTRPTVTWTIYKVKHTSNDVWLGSKISSISERHLWY